MKNYVEAFGDFPDELTVRKIQETVKANSICLFATGLANLPIQTRPMNTQYVDRDGSLWFFSNKDSRKNEAIREDLRVHLFYVDPVNEQFVTIYGQAQILFDREKIEEFWSAVALHWFTGKEDPQISLIKVAPENLIHWDKMHNKMAMVFPIEGNIEKKIIVKKVAGKGLTELEEC